MDFFTSALNKKLSVYFSLPDPMAWQENAFLAFKDNLDAYAFSLFILIRMVFICLMTSHCLRMTLIAPCWPHLEWFPDLLSLLVDVLRVIPPRPSLLRQPQSRRYHLNVFTLNFHTWRFSNVSSERGFS